jgi:hypothetical protein
MLHKGADYAILRDNYFKYVGNRRYMWSNSVLKINEWINNNASKIHDNAELLIMKYNIAELNERVDIKIEEDVTVARITTLSPEDIEIIPDEERNMKDARSDQEVRFNSLEIDKVGIDI